MQGRSGLAGRGGVHFDPHHRTLHVRRRTYIAAAALRGLGLGRGLGHNAHIARSYTYMYPSFLIIYSLASLVVECDGSDGASYLCRHDD
jgi:hypothetical protein